MADVFASLDRKRLEKMQNTRFKFLFVLGIMLTLGLTTAFAAVGADKKKKRRKIPKKMGAISVKTTNGPRVVRIDGKEVGKSGTVEGAEFYVTPGVHLVEVIGPKGKTFSREVNVVKKARHCICLAFVEKTTKRPCPYDMRVTGPDRVTEGDLATFVASNVAVVTPIAAAALKYAWKVSPSNARVTSGLGTNSITVDTTGLGGQTVNVDLAVTDGVYDATCRQRIAVPMSVDKLPAPKPVPQMFDEFPTVANDDDKARLDNLAIQLQNDPNAQGYIILYPGTDRRSQRRTPAKLTEMALNYLVKDRGVDPSRLTIVSSAISRPITTYQIWLVPPGAENPVAK